MADRPKILIVDDEPIVLDVTRMAIEMLNRFTVKAHDDPRSALAEFEADPAGFSLVITDFKMPWLNGTQLAARMRDLNPCVPIICLSAYVEAGASGSGPFTERMAKPFHIVELQERVVSLVRLAGLPGLDRAVQSAFSHLHERGV